MEEKECRDLLIVRYNNTIHAVEAPAYEADKGDLVEFSNNVTLVLGEVVDKMFCTKDSDEYRCISKIVKLHQARRIYKMRWEAWEGNDEECGG